MQPQKQWFQFAIKQKEEEATVDDHGGARQEKEEEVRYSDSNLDYFFSKSLKIK